MTDAIQRRNLPRAEDEDATARLLRLAGPRCQVPADRAARVRANVRLGWQAGAHRRAMRRRAGAAIGLLALAATVILAVSLGRPRASLPPAPAEKVATVERIEGEVGGLSSGEPVRAHQWVETGTARVALRLTDGTSLRLDAASRVRLLSPAVIELPEGTVYIDTGRDATGRRRHRGGEAQSGAAAPGLEVRTPMGAVHDIGTQFEIRVMDATLRLRVRSGVVELRHDDRSLSARPGMEVTMAPGGTLGETRTISSYGPEWEWAAAVAPAFEIEGRPLSAFLDHLAHEHGWTVRYSDAALAREASGIILHGSVSGLQPRDALAVALTTSGLSHRFRDGELVVIRTGDPK